MRVTLDSPFSLYEIRNITDAHLNCNVDLKVPITAISTDTRDCREGDLFIALEGNRESGEKYVEEALSKKCYPISRSDIKGVLKVKDTSIALSEISSSYKSKISPKYTIAVTGSVGKSTTVKFISALLKEKYSVHSTVGNFNNHIGVPLTLLAMPKGTEALVIELGMNHSGEISRLSKAVEPYISVITSIGTAHIGNLGSRENIARAKLEILDGMTNGKLLLPADEPLLSKIEGALYVGSNSSLSDYSLNNATNRTYTFLSARSSICGIEFSDARKHLVYDLAFAISVADILGLTKKQILSGIKAITNADLRQRFIDVNDFTIFDDSYNASIESITADIEYINSLGRPTGAFLGDVLELGDMTREIHERIGRSAAELKIGKLYLYGEFAEYTARGAMDGGMNTNRIYVNTDVSSPNISIEQIKKHHTPGEIILFKASHKLRLDKIADLIKSEENIQ